MGTAEELLETYGLLEGNYASFVDDGRGWKGDLAGIERIVAERDESLARGERLMARVRELWELWESESPDAQERSRVFAARNRLVELGLAASKADTVLQGKVRRRAEELRTAAADVGRKHKATVAYRRSRAGV